MGVKIAGRYWKSKASYGRYVRYVKSPSVTSKRGHSFRSRKPVKREEFYAKDPYGGKPHRVSNDSIKGVSFRNGHFEDVMGTRHKTARDAARSNELIKVYNL